MMYASPCSLVFAFWLFFVLYYVDKQLLISLTGVTVKDRNLFTITL